MAQQDVGMLVDVRPGHLDDPLQLLVHALLVLVHQVDLEDVRGGVVGAGIDAPLGVDLSALQLLHLFPAMLEVELDQVQDPLRVLPAHHLHADFEPFTHVHVHHSHNTLVNHALTNQEFVRWWTEPLRSVGGFKVDRNSGGGCPSSH